MALSDLMNLSNANHKQGLSEERIKLQLPLLRKLIAFFREYPDIFIDFIKGENCSFKFYTYQRIFLRVVMRHRYVYATFPRAYSKSFLSMMVLILRCIFYPNSHLFVTTGGKEQAASITVAKVDEICKLIPALSNEIDWSRGQSKKSKDDVTYIFKNGSVIDILPAKESSRGQRRTGGLMEECVLIDQTALNEIVIPTTNVTRLLPDGSRNNDEVINKSQIYITTAGYKNSFAYQRLIELWIQSLLEPDEVMILGGTYKTPVKEGLLDEDFVQTLKLQGTFSEESFDREYKSLWCGDATNAFYSSEKFDKYRILSMPEFEKSNKAKNSYYVIGVDVGRYGCTTEAVVFKVTPQLQGQSIKSLVNIFTYEAEHFEEQAIHLKKLYYKFQARMIAIDANGLGAGLVDFLTTTQIEPETGDILPPFGVAGGTSEEISQQYKKVRGTNVEEEALFLIKANASINTDAYSNAQIQMSSGKVKFLINESQAKIKLMSTKVGQNMSSEQRNEYLKPFILTSILREQTLNLIEENEGTNIILKQSSRSIKKDKFSAFIYGLYYIKKEEERLASRKKKNIRDFLFFT